VNDSGDAPLLLKPLAPIGDFEISLQALAKFDYFLDLSASLELPKTLRQVSTGRTELRGKWPFVVERDFHALVFLHKVHSPEPFAIAAKSHQKEEICLRIHEQKAKEECSLKREAGRFRKNFNV
jgi:hypothetical protein